MKLTIIPSDKAVYKDEVSYIGISWEGTPLNVHALQWKDGAGWIEFNDGSNNQVISSLPDWADNAVTAWNNANIPVPPLPPTAEQNKAIASSKLYATDWTTISDVSDPAKSNPYLTNSSEFIAYRNQIRQIAINPVAGEINWPATPLAIWG